MSFVLDIPPARERERIYAADVVFRHFLGLDVVVRQWDRPWWRLRSGGAAGDEQGISMPDVFFGAAVGRWLEPESLPARVDECVVEVPDSLPPMFGGSLPSAAGNVLNFDVLGAAFFMLSRYEELVVRERDRFDRFSSKSRCLDGVVDVRDPFIDRAVETLRKKIEVTWPRVTCRKSTFEIRVTHDVDALRNRGRPWSNLVVACGADVIRRRDIGLAMRRAWASRPAKGDLLDPKDPYNTFDFLMEESEKRGLSSHFYFVPGPRRHAYDPDYDVFQPDVQDLFQRIGNRGHRIGLHAGFDSVLERGSIAREFNLLRRATERAGVRQEEWGGRHHYLRWQPEVSWRQWADAQLDYDSSVGYAECPGFRCGTGRSFPVWDLQGECRLTLVERPLVLMESTLFSYQHLTDNQALDSCRDLVMRCRRFGGTLVLLWHNHNLMTPSSRDLYRAMLSVACETF
jgi:hypothetical protein